jgi:hypothetical protein
MRLGGLLLLANAYSATDLPEASFTLSFHCDLICVTTDSGSEM